MKKFNYRHNYFSVILLFTFFISCEESPETQETLSRLFRPVNFIVDVNGNSIHCNWTPIGNVTYLLEISRDSFLFVNDLKRYPVKENDTILGDLWSNTRYSARVKSVSKNTVTEDSGYKEITFITGTENIFNAVKDVDIGVNSILLKWNKDKEVSHIVVSTNMADNVIVSLSSTDISIGEKVFEGLFAKTTYTFKIYLGEMLRGTLILTTKSDK